MLALLAVQAALHGLLAGRMAAGQLAAVLLAGAIAVTIACAVERGARGWRRFVRWPAFLFVTMLWFAAGQALNAAAYDDKIDGARPQVVMLTSLPLRWGGGGDDLAQMLAEGPADLPALAALERAVDLKMVDTLDGELPPDATVLLAHPRALSPHDLVRIDAHRGRGGRIVILADALSSWPPPRPLGDPRNPPVTSLLTPLLDHWGIELAAPAADGAGDARISVGPEGSMLRLHSAGRFVRLPSGCHGYGDGLVVRCDGGRLWLVGDADMLDASLWQSPVAAAPWLRRSDNLAWLTDTLRGGTRSGFKPLWIRPRH